MRKGLGRIQRGCLRVIEEYDAAGKRPTILSIAAEIYRVGPARLSDAQIVATKRALASLCRMGLITGQQHLKLARSISDGRSERCCFWSTVSQ